MSDAGYMIDASALLALMLGEPGAERVQAALPHAAVSAVNLSEVVAKLQERGVPDDVVTDSIAELDLPIVAFDHDQAMRAGRLRMATRTIGLSLGDRACLAAAGATGRIALTTDRAWATVETGVVVQVAR
ncbi:PIN domain-containing protein [Sphingomonas sp. CFBP 13720]|uniref:PIN domain-containing protein n=1 Tax=Sphingomonas sp. CFBP 13720 TaxID=2775302 RepID=UPI0018D61C0B